MFSIYTVIGFAVGTGGICYFIGWIHGLNDGRESERRYLLSVNRDSK